MQQDLSQKRVFAIINPVAGGGRCRAIWEKMLPQLEAGLPDFFWQYTESAESAPLQVRRAICEQGAQVIVVVGGDGCMHDALNGLLEDDALLREDLVFVAYQAGSGCDLARTIYEGKQPPLLQLLREGVVQRVDIGRCDHINHAGQPAHRYFLNASDVGVGAETCVMINRKNGLLKRVLRNGKLVFGIAGFLALLTMKYQKMHIYADDRHYEGRYMLAALGNGRYMGGAMLLFPEARMDDGEMELLFAEKMGWLEICRFFLKVYDGSVVKLKKVHTERCSHLRVEVEGKPLVFELDGELPGTSPAEFTILPKALPLLFPGA